MAYRSDNPGQQRLNAMRQVVSHIQELLGSNDPFDLPGIVVVGGQSVGKSSLLEAISGIKLPSDSKICTKCPLQLEMYRSEHTSFSISYGGHPPRPISTLGEVTSEIVQATNTLTGGDTKIVDSMITVKICSPDACDLTVIDLPGMMGTAPAGFPEDTPKVVKSIVRNYTRGDNKIMCFLMAAYDDAGLQSAGLDTVRKRDSSGERTVGVLTKADGIASTATVRGHVEHTIASYPLRNGYVAVRTRHGHEEREKALSEDDIRKLEAEFFRTSADFNNPAPCELGIPVLTKKLEDLQLKMYSKCIPELQRKLDDKLSGFRKQLADLPETVDSPEAAMLLLTERLNKVANEAKAATSPNESSIDKDLRNEDAMRFGQKFLRASEKFVNAVNAGGAGSAASPKGLPGILWSQSTTEIVKKKLGFLEGATLPDSVSHPEIPGLVFEEVVYPVLASPAERLVDDVRLHVSNIFQTVVKFVYKHWPDVVPIILREVDDILAKQAVQANKSIAEAIEMLLGYHNTLNKRYLQTRNAFFDDAKMFNEKPNRGVEELKDMIFRSLPFMQTLFPGLLESGGIAGLLTEMTRAGQPPPEVSASAAASVISGQNGITQEHFAQICFAVYAQIVLDRVFDDLPLITRMFLVQRVHLLLERNELFKRLQTERCVNEVWSVMQAGQGKTLQEKQELQDSINEFERCNEALSNPIAAASFHASSEAAPTDLDVDVERQTA